MSSLSLLSSQLIHQSFLGSSLGRKIVKRKWTSAFPLALGMIATTHESSIPYAFLAVNAVGIAIFSMRLEFELNKFHEEIESKKHEIIRDSNEVKVLREKNETLDLKKLSLQYRLELKRNENNTLASQISDLKEKFKFSLEELQKKVTSLEAQLEKNLDLLEEDEAFKDMKCQILHVIPNEPFIDPTNLMSVYDREAISRHLQNSERSPVTRKPLEIKNLIHLKKYKELIDFCKKNGEIDEELKQAALDEFSKLKEYSVKTNELKRQNPGLNQSQLTTLFND